MGNFYGVVYALSLLGIVMSGAAGTEAANGMPTEPEGSATELTEHPFSTKTCLVTIPPALTDAIRQSRAQYADMPAANTDIAVVKQKFALLFHIDQGVRYSLIANMSACQKAGKKIDMKSWGTPLIAADKANEAALKVLLADIGWPKKAVYGGKATTTAFLIVQHADYDPAWQAEMLPRLAKLQQSGEIAGEDYALLYDRVQNNAHQPQYYGSQGKCDKDGWEPFPIRDAAHVDARRKAMGMEPEAAYAKMVTHYFCPAG